MTTVNQTSKFYLPFALPKYGTATQQNQYFVQQAGQYLMPMRSFAYGIVEQNGGVVVSADTRPYNAEFKVVNGAHFMQIMRAMGINITHMTEVPGGYKCHKDGNLSTSVCFVQKKATRGTGHVEYKAVLAMRQVAHELFIGVFPPQEASKDDFVQEALDTTSRAYQDAQQVFQTEAPTPEQVAYTTPLTADELEEISRRNEQQFIDEMLEEAAHSELPFPEVQISAADLPLGL